MPPEISCSTEHSAPSSRMELLPRPISRDRVPCPYRPKARAISGPSRLFCLCSAASLVFNTYVLSVKPLYLRRREIPVHIQLHRESSNLFFSLFTTSSAGCVGTEWNCLLLCTCKMISGCGRQEVNVRLHSIALACNCSFFFLSVFAATDENGVSIKW